MTDNSIDLDKVTQAYKTVFNGQPGIAVLDHLHRIFYDNDSFNADPYIHARNAGRRDVVRHILGKLSISDAPLGGLNDE